MTASAEAPARPPRRRRVLKWVLLALLFPVLLVLLVLGISLLGLQTGAGERLAARLAASKVSAILQGRLSVGRVRVNGALDVCLDQVSLDDPETGPVLTADSVCVSAQTLLLARERAVLRGVRIVHPVLDVATVLSEGGQKTNTLSRAIAARNPAPKSNEKSAPLAWVIEVQDLELDRGEVRLRPAPKAAPALDLRALTIHGAKARYAKDGAQAQLALTGELKAPGELPLLLELNATLAGSVDEGKLAIHRLRLGAGESGLVAQGNLELGTRKGELEITLLRVQPKDVDALRPAVSGKRPAPLLSSEVRGKGHLTSDGKTATARLSLELGGGSVELEAKSTLQDVPEWAVKLQARRIDPARVSPAAPSGEVTLLVDARGKGVPSYDEQGPLGELEGKLHVGPAHLKGVGELKLDLDARLAGRKGLVRAFTAAGIGLKLAAHGKAARDAVDLAVLVDAADLTTVARAIAVLTKKPASALEGSLHLEARVHGKPLAPDAEVHLKVPRLVSGESLDVLSLAIDGKVHGDLRKPEEVRPTGELVVAAQNVRIGDIELGHPRMRTDLTWPGAKINLVAEVLGGELQFLGFARLDDDRDGLIISELTVAYPGNELKLRREVNVHFRPKATVIEPFWLAGQHGDLGLSGTFYKATQKSAAGSLDALLQLSRFDLSKLPAFALPEDLNLHGLVSGRVVVDGKLPRPALDAHLEVAGGGMKRVQGVDVKVFAHVFKDRLQAEIKGTGPAGVRLSLKADAPIGAPKTLKPTAPLKGELEVRELDLAKAAEIAGNEQALEAQLSGKLDLRLVFEGTLGQPKVTASVDLRRLSGMLPKKAADQAAEKVKEAPPIAAATRAVTAAGNALAQAGKTSAPKPPPEGAMRVKDAELHFGLWIERGLAALDGYASLAGVKSVALVAQTQFDATRALHEAGYLQAALKRKVRATVTVAALDLKQLASLGLVPPGTEGKVNAAVELAGTPLDPRLSLTATAQDLASGKIRGLGGNLHLGLDKELSLRLVLTGGEDVLARLETTLAISAAELAQLRSLADPKQLAQHIADRKLTASLEVPGIFVGRAIALAGREKAPANGRLVGSVKVTGTPDKPRIVGKLALEEVVTRTQRLGHAEVYVEGGPEGATVHLGLTPPGGGTLLAHATLKADLTAHNLLGKGMAGLREGELDGSLTAKNLDLSFLSGINLLVRKAGGRLDGEVEAKGLLSKLHTSGKASLRGGLFDIVGQGIFHHVDFDATFSPKEVVLDRLVGQLGAGTFAAILVATQRALPNTDDGATRLEFTGEIHLGDDESVRDLKDDKGKPRQKRPLPIRQAGAERAEVDGEVDLFGSFDAGVLIANAKIPDATIHVLSLPSKKLQSLGPDRDVLLIHPGEKPHPPGIEPEEAEAEEQARKTATLRVQASLDLKHLYVRADDFEFPVRSNLNFEYDARRPDKPTADGTITVPNGSFTALGRRFNIENAVITETGGDIDDPELEVKARYEKASTVVFINVSGTARDPVIDLQSNPPMDQDAIAFFLATGRVQGRATQNGGGVDLSGAATSIAGSLLFGKVRESLADVLPVDVLTIEASGATISQASVGKYIGDKVFVGYRQRLTPAPNENSSEGRIEYEISRSVTAEATVGDQNSDISILWSHDF